MASLADIRQQHPEYGDMSDTDLAGALHRKYYADMPQDEFNAKMGIQAPQRPAPEIGGRDILAGAPELSWSEVGSQAIQNVPDSGKKFFSDMWTAVTNPIDTASTLYDVADGAVRLLAPGGDSPNEAKARAVGGLLSERYGTTNGFKNAIATDPVGMMGDLATVLTGGGFAAARAPGLAGKVGRIVQKAGNVIEPVNLAVKGVQGLGKVPGVMPALNKAGSMVGTGASAIAGSLTGAGTEVTKIAAQAGYKGGDAGKAWRAAIKGEIPWQGLVDDATAAVNKMHEAKGAAYVNNKKSWGESQTPLDFQTIKDAFNSIAGRGKFEGVDINPSTAGVVEEMAKVVEEWAGMNPAKFHTPLGLDALKKRLGDTLNKVGFENKDARGVVGEVYHAVKAQIIKAAPEYGKAMREYETASELIKNIENSFKLNKKSPNLDASVRALTSTLRDNVNTNYGARVNQAKLIEEAGAPNLMEKLAGASSSSAMPRGIQGAGSAAAGLTIAANAISGAINPLSLLLLGTTSPRLIGEAAHLGGRVAKGVRDTAGKVSNAARTPLGQRLMGPGARLGLMQAGRLENELRRKR